jgi:hypothetical protein
MSDDRPKVGPADPETRRRLLHEKLNEPTRAEGVATPPAPPKPKKKKSAVEEVADALNPKVPRERRFGPKGQTLDEVIDGAIKDAKPDNE